MERLTAHGAGYRTSLMPADAAARFCRCLRANNGFTDVAVEESDRAKNPEVRFFVSFAPANPQRQAELLARQQSTRSDRAHTEGAGYVWIPDPDHAFYHVLTLSGSVYEVDAQARGCSCPDYLQRCAGNGLKCKHLIAFEAGLGTFHTLDHWTGRTDENGDPLPLPEPDAPEFLAPVWTPESGEPHPASVEAGMLDWEREQEAERRARIQRDKALLWD